VRGAGRRIFLQEADVIDQPIRVLVVDDSPFARKVISEVLSARPDLEIVGTARDGLDALDKIEELAPDVITLDLVMPHLDGVGLLESLQPDGPAVVVVSMSERDSELAVAALQLGAFDLVHKPTALATERMYEMSDELVDKVRAAGASRRARLAAVPPAPAPARQPTGAPTRLVCIGCSTGGPQALTRLIPALPANFAAPVCVVVHMPAGFTDSLARRLDELSPLHVVEASDGLELVPGIVAIARGGSHLRVVSEGGLRARVGGDERAAAHRPSVDVLFESAAKALGSGVLAVVLTGMGDDGLKGSRSIVDQGGRILTESASSCIVHGMPRTVLEAGLSMRDLPLDQIAAELVRRVEPAC
jgi:two-component system, chemotaxis family, protein-glutamate methylesterase/glutaminase